MTNKAGIDEILQAAANDWFLSISTLQTLKSRANESMVGVICRQGPHHSAQKSTSTGTRDWRTSFRQLNSLSNITISRLHLSLSNMMKLLPICNHSVCYLQEFLVGSQVHRAVYKSRGRQSASSHFISHNDLKGLGRLDPIRVTIFVLE